MSKTQYKLTNKDLFALINTLFFLWLCYAVYFDRFINYRGRENIWEFFVYAVVILIVILFAWILMRKIHISNKLLIFAEIILIIHFAGGLVILHGNRLYDNIFFGIRYDKYAHTIQTFLGGFIFYKLYFEKLNVKWWIKDLQLMMIILGIGAMFEIVEYLVTLTVTTNGVGDYDNNMQDMISNLIGITISILVIRISNFIQDRQNR
ncbi:MAG: DUF2238 domain-containing protein [Planctomycetia bacterium]|nr:DUF2238 domain-containing protein [Planctomycetia bacterium]